MRAGIFHQQCASVWIAKNRRSDLLLHRGAFFSRGGDFVHEPELARQARVRDWANIAARGARRANRLAQFHQRLIPIAGSITGQQILRSLRELLPTLRGAKVAFDRVKPRQHARDVAIEHGQRHVVRDTQHGRRRVAADAGKFQCGVDLGGKFSAVARHDLLCRSMQVARAAVVTEARPKF